MPDHHIATELKSLRRDIDDLIDWTLDLQRQALELKAGFNPNELRVPAGQEGHGQWTSISDTPSPLSSGKPARGKPGAPPVPPYKADVFNTPKQKQAWADFNARLQATPALSGDEKFAYAQVFAAEGGLDKDPDGSAVAGITQATLDEARQDPGLAAELTTVKTPSDLDGAKAADIYRYYFDSVLDNAGGSAALALVGNPLAAAALADTAFRAGKTGAGKIVLSAVNDVYTNQGFPRISVTLLPGQDVVIGPRIFSAYSSLAKNPATLGLLLRSLAEARKNSTPGEGDRIEHFKF